MEFYAHGKLMISGEYLVLDGASALAFPTRLGQGMKVLSRQSEKGLNIHWRSLDHSGKLWFEAHLGRSLNVLTSTDDEVAKRLYRWLITCTELNPNFLSDKTREYEVTTTLEFDPEWGLGSSSTMLSMLASWAEVDAYQLLEQAFKGSGYDLACAIADGPILYNRKHGPSWEPVAFEPSFGHHLWFVYLGQKQRSLGEVIRYESLDFDRDRAVYEVDGLTQDMLRAKNLHDFELAMVAHEELISSIIGVEPIKQQRFMDFQGEVKSLGAWGGDFVLVTSEVDPTPYFTFKGCPTVVPFREMLIQPKD